MRQLNLYFDILSCTFMTNSLNNMCVNDNCTNSVIFTLILHNLITKKFTS